MTPRTRILLAGLAALFACAWAQADAPHRAVYLHGNLIDTAAGTLRSDVAISVRSDRIEAVEEGRGFHPPAGSRVVDIRGKYVLPGLINTHVHLATAAEPTIARAYLRRELFSGVTTVRDMAGDVRLLAELEREAEFDEIVSPDIVYSALFAGPSFFVDARTHEAARGRVAGETPWMRAVSEDSNLPLLVAQAYGTGATGIKLYGDLSAVLVREIAAEAHRQHLRVWAHAAVFPAKPSDVAAADVDVMSHACLLGYEVSDPPLASAKDTRPIDGAKALQRNEAIGAVLAAMKQRNTILDATVWIYDVQGAHSCTGKEAEYLANAAYRAGVLISVGTDDDPDWRNADSSMDDELDSLVTKVGMSTAEVLKSATVIGARVVGEETTAGTVEPGKLANFVVLDANPLDDIRNIRRVHAVVKHGIHYLRSMYKPFEPAPDHH